MHMTEDEFRGYVERATQQGSLDALDAVVKLIGDLRGHVAGETGPETRETAVSGAEGGESDHGCPSEARQGTRGGVL